MGAANNPDPKAFRSHIRRFSCKPPGHDAARQRENQRRHRARVKSRIAELETALSDAQARLSEALQRIDALAAEVQRLRALGPADINNPPSEPQPRECQAATPESADPAKLVTGDAAATWEPPEGPRCCLCSRTTGIRGGGGGGRGHNGAAEPAADVDPRHLQDDCPLLPAPGEGESTIPCREAYSIIRGCSASSDFDLAVADEWLRPGFRRAVAPGSGCRVQTHVLFAFVDRLAPG
ncbi:hypothetical protein VTH06DRAFT_7673 [Thermothelomyces fergusii]